MIRASVTPGEAAAFLTELAAIDPGAMTALLVARVPCSVALEEHPTVQVGVPIDHRPAEVGFLGVINGLFGTIEDGGDRHGWGPIVAHFDSDPDAEAALYFTAQFASSRGGE